MRILQMRDSLQASAKQLLLTSKLPTLDCATAQPLARPGFSFSGLDHGTPLYVTNRAGKQFTATRRFPVIEHRTDHRGSGAPQALTPMALTRRGWFVADFCVRSMLKDVIVLAIWYPMSEASTEQTRKVTKSKRRDESSKSQVNMQAHARVTRGASA